jgi:predicted Zn-dependent protease
MSGAGFATRFLLRAVRPAGALLALAALIFSPVARAGHAPSGAEADRAADQDQTLRALRDELARSRARLRAPTPGAPAPYFIEYRLLDIEQKTLNATFGALLSSNVSRNRLMDVRVRVGDYKLDSSNFISGDEGFQGFIGSTGSVGIDGDYDSLRQDLWLATDHAYKEALVQLSQKNAYLMSLARPSDIPDFSHEQPVVFVNPKAEADWTSRNWEQEARDASAVLRSFPELYNSHVSYYLVTMNFYLFTSEGAEIRVPKTLAAIEASLQTQAADGMRLHNFYVTYAKRPADLPDAATVREGLERAARELIALRNSPAASDIPAGPVLLDAPAAASLLAQTLGPSVSGARPPLALGTMFDRLMKQMGGTSEWGSRLNTRVFPAGVTLVDDPTRKEFDGHPLLGSYDVDEEGLRAQRVDLVDNGILKDLLMSRRPGPEFQQSNAHGRAGFLSDPRATMSNLFFQATETKSPADLRKQFLALCHEAGREWCIEVRRMDNPALGFQRQDEIGDAVGSLAEGLGNGDRLPLVVYRINASDGREELVRGATLTGLKLGGLRRIAGIGNDYAVFNFMQSEALGFAGTALGAFGNAQGGLPSSLVAPSLLLEEVDVRGARGEPHRPPLLPPPPMN